MRASAIGVEGTVNSGSILELDLLACRRRIKTIFSAKPEHSGASCKGFGDLLGGISCAGAAEPLGSAGGNGDCAGECVKGELIGLVDWFGSGGRVGVF